VFTQAQSGVVDLLIGFCVALAAAIVALGIALARTREVLFRLETKMDDFKEEIKQVREVIQVKN
jgi:hypothetical protein